MRGVSKHERLASVDVCYENIEEIDDDFDIAEPAFILVYRRIDRLSGGENRFVSCVRSEIIERFSQRIYGEKISFAKAMVQFMDLSENEHKRQITVPSCFVFEEVPEKPIAKSIVMSNRTLFRNFAPVLKGNVGMRFLYEKPFFKIRSGHDEEDLQSVSHHAQLGEEETRFQSLSLTNQSAKLTPMERFRRSHETQIPRRSVFPGGKRASSKDHNNPPIRTRERQTFSLEVDPCQTVGELKMKIFESRGYSPEMQHLVFNGVPLADADRLADFEIREKSTLMLWLRSADGTMRQMTF